MTLEEFEASLAKDRRERGDDQLVDEHDQPSRAHRRHHHHHHHHKRKHRHDREADEHGRKRSRFPDQSSSRATVRRTSHSHTRSDSASVGGRDVDEVNLTRERGSKGRSAASSDLAQGEVGFKRDSWMEAPPALEIDYIQKGTEVPSQSPATRSSKADFELKIHAQELNKHHLKVLAEGREIPAEVVQETARHVVDYTFGDAGAQWRMTKLKNVFKQAAETGVPAEDVAENVYGDLRSFDDAREEQIELERRDTYGPGYVGKEKPSGELFQDRKMQMGVRRESSKNADEEPTSDVMPPPTYNAQPATSTAVPLDHTALNRLKAQMMKAKLRGSTDASRLEAEYEAGAKSSAGSARPDPVVLGAMENRMLAGSRKGEVKTIKNKRGRERGLVEENEDMSIEDMVREERRNRYQVGGDSQRFAERIAKDAKFNNDLDYMDENAAKLAKRVHKSELNLKNGAIADFQKTNRILDNCPLCHREDTGSPPIAPIVSLATRTYLTLPTEPEISEGGACIVPVQHRINLLECDDDEWEEIRNFMKSLTRMYHDQGRDVIFYENAAAPQRKKHAAMEVIPLPYSLGQTAPAFFKEAILTADEEWTQHKKLIDTLAKANQGLGKLAFRKTLVKEMPYFHVWFQVDGGLGHIVEDSNRWPKGDLFAREIIGGMLDKGPDVIKRQGRWHRTDDTRIDGFRKRWRKFDWTRVLTDT